MQQTCQCIYARGIWQVPISLASRDIVLFVQDDKAKSSRRHSSRTCFLVSSHWWGKSLVCDTFGSAMGGIVWCISPLLALGADQTTKLTAQCQDANIIPIHLDEYKPIKQQQTLQCCLASISCDGPVTVVVFSSPQALVSSEINTLTFKVTVNKQSMRLLVLDEAHLFVQFGLCFQTLFGLL